MRGLSLVLVLVTACYDPSPLAGSPCSDTGTCPETLVCTGGFCLLPGVGADAPGADGAGDDAAIDAAVDAALDAPMPATWSVPVPVAGVNTASKESDPSVTADLLELYFVSARAGGAGLDDIWYTKRASPTSPWDPPSNVTGLDSADDENSVEISPDGSTVWFLSSRGGKGDVYTATKTPTGWTIPAVVAELSSTDDETGVAISPDGLTAIVDRGAAGARKMYIATRAGTDAPFGPLAAIAAINNAATDPSSASVTNNANAIYFHADTIRNIYKVTRVGAGWSTPTAVTEVNGATRDAAPFVTQSETYMVFERDNQLLESHR